MASFSMVPPPTNANGHGLHPGIMNVHAMGSLSDAAPAHAPINGAPYTTVPQSETGELMGPESPKSATGRGGVGSSQGADGSEESNVQTPSTLPPKKSLPVRATGFRNPAERLKVTQKRRQSGLLKCGVRISSMRSLLRGGTSEPMIMGRNRNQPMPLLNRSFPPSRPAGGLKKSMLRIQRHNSLKQSQRI